MTTLQASAMLQHAASTEAAVPEEHVRHRRPYGSVLETIGWTPMIRLSRIARGIRTPFYGKADFFNPGGSVKDRVGMPRSVADDQPLGQFIGSKSGIVLIREMTVPAMLVDA